MNERSGQPHTSGQISRIVAMGPPVATFTAWLILALLSAPIAQAQAPIAAEPTPTQRQQLLLQQTRPQKEVPFNPEAFDKFAGYYQHDFVFAHAWRDGSRYYLQLTGQPSVEFFPESPTKFFATVVAAQISFSTGRGDRVTGMVVHQNGRLVPFKRVSATDYAAAQDKLQQRIKNNEPSSGTEAAVRRQLEALEASGQPLYDEMAPALAQAARQQATRVTAMVGKLGTLTSIQFDRVLPNGFNDYTATFANGQLEVIISPLSSDGKILGLLYRPVP